MDHVTMQDSLVAIGQKLKGTYGKDSAKMQQVLPAELLKAELQKITIVPAYNPRLHTIIIVWKLNFSAMYIYYVCVMSNTVFV